MSTPQLRSVLSKELSEYLNRIRSKDSQQETTRIELEKKAAMLLITEDQLQAGSIVINSGSRSYTINKQAAELLMNMITEHVVPKYPKYDPSDIAIAIEQIKAKVEKGGKYHWVRTPDDVLRINFTGTVVNNVTEANIEVVIIKTASVRVTGGYVFIGRHYDDIQKVLNVITKEVMKQLQGNDTINKAIRSTYGREKNKALAEVGHLDLSNIQSTNSLTTWTVARGRIHAALKRIPQSGKLRKLGLTKDMGNSIAEAIRKQALNYYSNLGVKYNSKFIKEVSDLGKLGMSIEMVLHVIQSHEENWGILGGSGGIEATISKKILRKDNINHLMNKLANSNPGIPYWESSPSFVSSILNTVKHKFFSAIKKIKSKYIKVRVPKTKPSKNSITKATDTVPVPITKKIRKIAVDIDDKTESYGLVLNIELPPVKDEDSCQLPTNKLLAIKGRLNYEINNAIKANMQLPALVYRTGRFARSVKIAGVLQNPDCSITAYYRYMVAPYAVFDPSISNYRNLSSPTRNPQKIIGDSIRDIARTVMRDRYTIRPQWV